MAGNCYNICYSASVIYKKKKQRTTFDDELFQSHVTHDLCTYTIQMGERSVCLCVRVCARVDTGH
jgi:hypothetical protein